LVDVIKRIREFGNRKLYDVYNNICATVRFGRGKGKGWLTVIPPCSLVA